MNQPKQAQGQASGKIILMGEHAVVYKQPALALPFPATKVITTVTPTYGETTIDCDFYHGLLTEMPELLESLKKAIEQSLKELNVKKEALNIQIESSIPAERGMGSSAAVAVATVRALFHYYQQPLLQNKLLAIVAQAEKIAHGNPSGLDALMTSGENPIYYIKGQEPQPLKLNLDAILIVADTGETGQTKEALEDIATQLVSSKAEGTKRCIYELGRLTKKAREALETNQPSLMGHLMNEAQKNLKELNVSSEKLNRLINVATKAGALGSKLTGGGRGGCLIALAQHRQEANYIRHVLEKEGATHTWLYEMSERNE